MRENVWGDNSRGGKGLVELLLTELTNLFLYEKKTTTDFINLAVKFGFSKSLDMCNWQPCKTLFFKLVQTDKKLTQTDHL